MMNEQPQQPPNQETYNYGHLSRPNRDPSILQIRLNSDTIIEKIEIFLKGSKVMMVQDNEGNISQEVVTSGKPKMNDEGIRSILNWISGTVNSQVVQGNFPADKHGFSQAYNDYVKEYQINLTCYIVLNAPDWEMNDLEIDGIIDFIMLLIIPFTSRLISNKERDSYSDTIKSIENTSLQSRGSGLNIFKK